MTTGEIIERIAEAARAHDPAATPAAAHGFLIAAALCPGPKIGRNDPCPCGRKYKKCCLGKGRGIGRAACRTPGARRSPARRSPAWQLRRRGRDHDRLTL